MTYQDLKGPIQATSSDKVQTLVHRGTIFFNLTVPDPEESLHNNLCSQSSQPVSMLLIQ